MPNTTNFNWATPADTDLVKDGAAAIRTLGSSIDTSLVDLKGGTTGQILSKASNTDLDYTWINNDQGDITEVVAGTGLSGGGSSGSVTLTNTVATAFDAAGDLVYGTGADTFTKLGIGTAGQVLSVNSGATAPEWVTPSSGGMTLISTTTLSGASTTISSIPSGYNNLLFYLTDYKNNTNNGRLSFDINASTNAQNYFNYNDAAGSFYTQTSSTIKPFGNNEVYTTGSETHMTFQINNYVSSTSYKDFFGVGSFYSVNSRYDPSFTVGAYLSTSAVTSIVIATSAGTMSGTIRLYGVK